MMSLLGFLLGRKLGKKVMKDAWGADEAKLMKQLEGVKKSKKWKWGKRK